MPGPLSFNSQSQRHSFRAGAASGSDSVPAQAAAVYDRTIGATIHGSTPSLDAGRLEIQGDLQTTHPVLCNLCKQSTFNIQQAGKTTLELKEKPSFEDLAVIVIKCCAPSIEANQVTAFSILFQREKIEITYSDGGVSKTLKVDLSVKMKEWGDKDAATLAFRKLQQKSKELKGFEGQITPIEIVINARSGLVKTGSIGSRAAVEITSALKLTSIVSKEGLFRKKDSQRSQYLAVKINEALGTKGPLKKSSVAYFEQLQKEQEQTLEKLASLIAAKQKSLTAAQADADKQRLKNEIADLERLEQFLLIEPRQTAPGEDIKQAIKTHVAQSVSQGVSVKVAIALVMKEKVEELKKQTPPQELTVDQMQKLAEHLNQIYLGQKVQTTWDKIKSFGFSPSLTPAIDRAAFPFHMDESERVMYKEQYKQSAKQMAADTVALLFNLEKDQEGKEPVRDKYAQLSSNLKTSVQSRDLSDLLFTAYGQKPSDKASLYQKELALTHIPKADLQTLFS